MLPWLAGISLSLLLSHCNQDPPPSSPKQKIQENKKPVTEEDFLVPNDPYLIILGIAQDAGYPQANCQKKCCKHYWDGAINPQEPVALGIVDPKSNKCWLVEATPDIKHQLHQLQTVSKCDLEGMFLTHAHIGHYTGLMHLGREVMGASEMPVYAMPRMKTFLENNGPWDQLVKLRNISLKEMQADSAVQLTDQIAVTPVLVPHRDEYSETVGFVISGPEKSVLFIPDIDKWDRWQKDIKAEVNKVDFALLDATFFAHGEIPGRNMDEIPHPFVEESMRLFNEEPDSFREKICFVHFNHTNPLIYSDSVRQTVVNAGFQLAVDGRIIEL